MRQLETLDFSFFNYQETSEQMVVSAQDYLSLTLTLAY